MFSSTAIMGKDLRFMVQILVFTLPVFVCYSPSDKGQTASQEFNSPQASNGNSTTQSLPTYSAESKWGEVTVTENSSGSLPVEYIATEANGNTATFQNLATDLAEKSDIRNSSPNVNHISTVKELNYSDVPETQSESSLSSIVFPQSHPTMAAFKRNYHRTIPIKFPGPQTETGIITEPSPSMKRRTHNEQLSTTLTPNSGMDTISSQSSPEITVTQVYCYQTQCAQEQGISVYFHSAPSMVPWYSNVTFECNVAVPANANFTIWWKRIHSSKYAEHSSDTPTEYLKEEKLPATGTDNETIAVTSILILSNVSSSDSGYYTCALQLTTHCCFINATKQLITYHPPNHNTDLIIIVCVCILQALLILFVYTKSREIVKEPKLEDIPLQTFQYKPIKDLSSIEGEDEANQNDNVSDNESDKNESNA